MLWDFGGRDTFHSAHSLFMRTGAVFVVFWMPEQEALFAKTTTILCIVAIHSPTGSTMCADEPEARELFVSLMFTSAFRFPYHDADADLDLK